MAMDWSPSLPLLPQRSWQRHLRHSSPIWPSEGPLQQAATQRAEEEAGAEEDSDESDDDGLEVNENEVFIRGYMSSSDKSMSKSDGEVWEEDEKDEAVNNRPVKCPWIKLKKSSYAREKLVRILAGKTRSTEQAMMVAVLK